MAFQPIVSARTGKLFAAEALVRGKDGRGAAEVLGTVNQENRYAFDQLCRVTALEWGARIGLDALLSINFLPEAVYNPEHCLRATLVAAERVGRRLDQIVFEVTEDERVRDTAHLLNILNAYRAKGLLTAIDDFGAGYAGLNLLADFQPDLVKLDMHLVRGLAGSAPRQSLVRHVTRMCEELGVQVIGEGVETADDAKALLDLGIELQQGFLFARPGFETLPPIVRPDLG
jgi:EAL domain-containing protein (putative c-di-GMP-specific phosphodiesterase class I)